MRRTAAFFYISILAIAALGGCSYLFPSCATIPGCPNGEVLCNNLTCSDLRTDPFNCGMCNNECGAGLACVPDAGDAGEVGTAACGCALQGQILVQGQCIDLAIDPANCGAVGHACRLDQACLDGGCGCLFPSYLASMPDGGSGECATDAGGPEPGDAGELPDAGDAGDAGSGG